MKKNKKLHQLWLISAITSSILIASSIAVTVPLILNTNNNTNTLNDTKETKMVTTGNITHDASVPVVNSLAEVDYSSLEIGNSSSIIVNQNGKKEIYVWGLNDKGQLGLGDTQNKLVPTLFDTSVFGEYANIEISICKLEAEPYGTSLNLVNKFSYAIIERMDSKKELYTWGYNGYGQLGLGTFKDQLSPKQVPLDAFDFPDSILSITGNSNNLFVMTQKNKLKRLYACGAGNYGQLGQQGDNSNSNIFRLINPSSLGNYASIENFEFTQGSCKLTIIDAINNWSVYVWGRNDYGQLGLEHDNPVTSPNILNNAIFSSDLLKVSNIQISLSSYLLNTLNQKIYVWGKNNNSQLGLGINQNIVTTITELTTIPGGAVTVINIQVDESSYVLIDENGIKKLYVWGNNSYGYLGLGNTTNRTTPTLFDMSKIGFPTLIKHFSINKSSWAAGESSYALVETNNGMELYGWGINTNNQLGISGLQSSPVKITSPNNFPIIDASIKNQTKIRVDNNGVEEVYVSGLNNFGQLGNATTTNTTTPVQILSAKESTPSAYTNKTFNLSAGDALKSFYGELTNIYNENELLKYIDISTLPSNANLSIDPANTIINSSEGVLNLTLVTDSYYELFKNGVVNNKKSFQFSINGFLKVSDIPIVTKITPNITNENFFQNAVVGNTVNRNYLSQFINLDCIPADAILTIEPIKTDISSEIKFVLKSNKVYKNNGVSTNENYSQTFSFTMKPGIDPILVIGLIAGGCFLLLLIFVIVYMSKSTIRKI